MFKQYRRTQIAEMRPVTEEDIEIFERFDNLPGISISDVDLDDGSPKIGDMVARNPKNHLDQWLVAEQYFNDNFEDINAF